MQYEMIRNADVQVECNRTSKNFPKALVTINGAYDHEFDEKSRVSKALETMTPEDLGQRLSGGSYFIVNGELVDFRDGQYNGFVHTDESIVNLVDVLGIHPAADVGMKLQKNQVSGNIVLGRQWSDHGITIEAYREGGEFKSVLSFGWNPFVRTVNSAFMLWRLICTNGMRGLTSILNTRIPLINRWEEHLEIASRQIQNKVDGLVRNRLYDMGHERASVSELSLIAHHAQQRLNDSQVTERIVRDRLENIVRIASPELHLGEVYQESVFMDKRIGSQLPAHLSVFDAWNLATELRSHTTEVAESTEHGLDMFANDLIFNRKDLTRRAAGQSLPQLSVFSDPEAAFHGVVH